MLLLKNEGVVEKYVSATSFSSLLEASERKISLDYLIGFGQVYVAIIALPQRTVQHLKGMEFSVISVIFKKTNSLLICSQPHKAHRVVL